MEAAAFEQLNSGYDRPETRVFLRQLRDCIQLRESAKDLLLARNTESRHQHPAWQRLMQHFRGHDIAAVLGPWPNFRSDIALLLTSLDKQQDEDTHSTFFYRTHHLLDMLCLVCLALNQSSDYVSIKNQSIRGAP